MTEQKTLEVKLKSIVSEKELREAQAGDLIKVRLSSSSIGIDVKPRRMVYEGIIKDKAAFMEHPAKAYPYILSWRSGIRYLQFCDTLKDNRRIGVVIFSDLYRDFVEYSKKGTLYDAKRKLLIAANQWRGD